MSADKVKIALLDNNDFHLVLMERALSEGNDRRSLSVYRSGEAMFKDFRKRRFDLIISELVLTDMNGLELLLRARQVRRGQGVIIVTAHGDEQAAVRAMKSGAADYISKQPGYIAELLEAVQKTECNLRIVGPEDQPAIRPRDAERLDLVTLMVSTLNHEINNPLMAILTTVELLLSDAGMARDKVRQKLKMIERSTRRIEKITRRMENLISTSVRHTPAGPMLKLKGKGASRFRKPEPVSVSE